MTHNIKVNLWRVAASQIFVFFNFAAERSHHRAGVTLYLTTFTFLKSVPHFFYQIPTFNFWTESHGREKWQRCQARVKISTSDILVLLESYNLQLLPAKRNCLTSLLPAKSLSPYVSVWHATDATSLKINIQKCQTFRITKSEQKYGQPLVSLAASLKQ